MQAPVMGEHFQKIVDDNVLSLADCGCSAWSDHEAHDRKHDGASPMKSCAYPCCGGMCRYKDTQPVTEQIASIDNRSLCACTTFHADKVLERLQKCTSCMLRGNDIQDRQSCQIYTFEPLLMHHNPDVQIMSNLHDDLRCFKGRFGLLPITLHGHMYRFQFHFLLPGCPCQYPQYSATLKGLL